MKPGVSELDHLDAIAGRLLATMAPLRFAVAATDADRRATFRLRYEAVLRRGWADPAAFPDGLERDEYDDVAVHLGGWEGDKLVATGRIVFPSPGLRLPTEAAFDLVIEPVGTAANVDRMTIAASHSDVEHRLLLGLLGATWREVRLRGFHIWVGIHSPAMFRLYRRLGLTMEILGPPRLHWGEERYPVRFDGRTGAAEFIRRWREAVR